MLQANHEVTDTEEKGPSYRRAAPRAPLALLRSRESPYHFSILIPPQSVEDSISTRWRC